MSMKYENVVPIVPLVPYWICRYSDIKDKRKIISNKNMQKITQKEYAFANTQTFQRKYVEFNNIY